MPIPHASSPAIVGPIPGEAHLAAPAFRVSLAERGYTEEEYFISGTATAYTSAQPMPADGRIAAQPGGTAPYATRLLVRRPADAERFNGTVLLEWLNVSGGTDAAPDYAFLHCDIERKGYVWVGVSAQKGGLEGIPGMPMVSLPVKTANPVRYGPLVHPGDAYAFDIFSQAALAIRGCANAPAQLQSLHPQRLLALGESQSAFFLTTYVNAIDPLVQLYDGFLIHARGGFAASLTGVRLDGHNWNPFKDPVKIRTDVRVPVLILQSETDLMVLGSVMSRQPDAARIRLWEIAGAAHADTYQLIGAYHDCAGADADALAAALAPISSMYGMAFGTPINSGPQQHYIANSALEHLNRWVRDGTAPPTAARLEVDPTQLRTFVLDELGFARGGIRSPWVDVPTSILSGLGQIGIGFAPLFGTTRPFDAGRLRQLYPKGRADYLARFAASTQDAINAGFVLEADQPQINALAAAACP